MATKPSTKPEWATLDPIDGVSGQPAIIEPSASKKNSGFLRLERPPRQDLNWILNLLDLWVDYFEEFTEENETDIGLNTGHRLGDGSDHADVFQNTTDIGTNAIAIALLNNSLVWVDATNFGMIQLEVATDDNINAINAAFAISPFVFIPAGNYQVFSSGLKINIPDGGILAGAGASTLLQIALTKDIFNVTNKNCMIHNLNLFSTAAGVMFTPALTEKRVFRLSSCIIGGITTDQAINLDSSDESGLVVLENCFFDDAFTVEPILESTTNTQSRLIAINNTFKEQKIILGGFPSSQKLFSKNKIIGGEITIKGGRNVIFDNNEIDIDAFFFEFTKGAIFRNNLLGDVNANTVNNNVSGNASRVLWLGNRALDDSVQDADNAIRGIKVVGDWSGGNEIIANGEIAIINYDNVSTVMARNNNYLTVSGDSDVYTAAVGEFRNIGTAGGRVLIDCQIILDQVVTADIDIYLKLNNSSFPRLFEKIQLSGSNTIHTLRTEFRMAIGDTLRITIDNNTGGNINILTTAGFTGNISLVSIEGL